MKPLFLEAMNGDLLKLVHLSNGFQMLPDVKPLKLDDVVESTSRIGRSLIKTQVRWWRSVRQYLGRHTSDESHKSIFIQGRLLGLREHFSAQGRSSHDSASHIGERRCSAQIRDWFHLKDPNIDLLDKKLTFRLESLIRFKKKDLYSSVETKGLVLFESSTKEVSEVATVKYEAGCSHGNPVIDYLERHGIPIERPHMFDNVINLSGTIPTSIQAPASNELYARVSGDHNPIHVSRVVASYVNLKEILPMVCIQAAVRGFVEVWAADNDVERVRSFKCSFVDMVLPNDHIEVKLWHVGMVSGRKIVKVEAFKNSGIRYWWEAEVEQPVTAYIFTGQVVSI
jgi:fatty acid synthase subunit beta